MKKREKNNRDFANPYSVQSGSPYARGYFTENVPSRRKGELERLAPSGWAALIVIPLLVFLTVFFLIVYVGRPYIVHGLSMYPTLHDGDRVFVVPYRGNTTPSRGDIIVLKGANGVNEMLIKRVVALSGDYITIGKNSIVVNGVDTYKNSNYGSETTYTVMVPQDSIYVMGDNEKVSFDSRSFGPVSMNHVVGKALFIFWPLSHFRIF